MSRAACCLSLLALVAGVPSFPPPITANAVALQQTIDKATMSAVPQTLKIQAGNYIFSNTSLQIANARNLAIEAYNVTFVFYYGFGVDISQCHNLSVRGLTLDSDPPNYAQGVVRSVTNTTTIVAEFDDRFLFPDTTTQPFSSPGGTGDAKVMFWDPHTKLTLVPGSGINFMNSSTPLGKAGAGAGGGSWQVLLKKTPLVAPPVGSLVTIFPRRGITWRNQNSSAVLAEDVTIHAGGNMGFLEQLGAGGHTYRRVAIVRKPGSDGLMALNADGFHSTSVGTGPTLEDSEISFTGDDHLNILARMLVVCESLDAANSSSNTSSSLAVIDMSGGGIRTGDEMKFFELLPGKAPGRNPLLGR